MRSRETTQPDWKLEDEVLERGYLRVAGVDEAGRGPWAGPVVAAAVVVPVSLRDQFPPGVNDSKKMTAAARSALYESLEGGQGWDTALGEASVEEIDKMNILQAAFLAMQRAVESLKTAPDYLLVDGNVMPAFALRGHAVVKGDGRSLSIAAASILAKEYRDRMMCGWAEQSFPGYGFARHKGYGTRQHQEALARLGVSLFHRRSFSPVRKLLEKQAG